MEQKIVATHNGNFHADEVFAIAILKKIHSDLKIVRTRDPKLLEKADFRTARPPGSGVHLCHGMALGAPSAFQPF